MAKCASITQIFDKPLPPNPTLIDSLSSWRHQIKSIPPDLPSLTEIFGELQFNDPSFHQPQNSNHHEEVQEEEDDVQVDDVVVNPPENNATHPFQSKSPEASSFTELFGELYSKEPSSLPISQHPQTFSNENNSNDDADNNQLERTKSGLSDDGSTSSLGSVNLQLCTEGLGFESFDVERNESVDYPKIIEQVGLRRHTSLEIQSHEYRKLRHSQSLPPPISSIGRNGKPWVYLRSYRHDGRFILKQFSIPTQVFFNAYREDGRLRLHPVRPVRHSTKSKDGEVKCEQSHELDDEEEKE